MIRTLLVMCAMIGITLSMSRAASADGPTFFEMRTYYANPGKFDAMMTRFRDHTCALFEKHGMVNVGYFVPEFNPDGKLVYVLGFADADARVAAWKAFADDPQWQKAYKESEVDGVLVGKVESLLLVPTDFSPAYSPSASDAAKKVYELRDYTATKGNLDGLLARFRDHTCKLFETHGMTNVIYFTLAPKQDSEEKQELVDRKLIYFLAHDSEAAAKESFDAFRKDPAWDAARKESEAKAGGSLTEAEGGVKSAFFLPTDYSPLK
jgi:hypothetical protein